MLILIKWEGPLGQYDKNPDIYFTDNPYFPTGRLNEAVLPVINEDWADKNNKFCCLGTNGVFSKTLNKEVNDPKLGRYCKLEGASVNDGISILVVCKMEKKPEN